MTILISVICIHRWWELGYRAVCEAALEPAFPASHAPTLRHTVITAENAIGIIKRYITLTTVIAAKQRANAQAMPRMRAKVSAGSPPSCQANIAENRRNTPMENPAATKRSQYVLLNPACQSESTA